MVDLPKPQALFMEPALAVEVQQELNLGPCRWIDIETRKECGKPGIKKVSVGSKPITAAVELCSEHIATHNRMFAERRKTR